MSAHFVCLSSTLKSSGWGISPPPPKWTDILYGKENKCKSQQCQSIGQSIKSTGLKWNYINSYKRDIKLMMLTVLPQGFLKDTIDIFISGVCPFSSVWWFERLKKKKHNTRF